MHHANLLVGSRSWALSRLPEDLRMAGADVVFYGDEQFSVAHARELGREASLRPIERSCRTFIITCRTMLHEAQNALLKLFEEPNDATIFYLIVPSEEMLLPTLRSRLHLLEREHAGTANDAFETFRKATYAKRLEMVKEHIEGEDIEWARTIIRGAEVHAEATKDPDLMRTVLPIAFYASAPGASLKMLLEHLALSL